ncbi:methyl-accepting chemotaxis protein [Gulbenkiania mobilis]|uniref:Methyl-accepting chemotaxis protein n=1 Tax=Gulbenkiania mobilis TaxID=397457 RepID=A0ABY2CZF8_GULMO|nr:methyl-accepting chemotaxis protein [Gulbenkiania mobilis]TCW33060.1 methyl-accepting chemotaxis protein [Gulbenkiania mobilis]
MFVSTRSLNKALQPLSDATERGVDLTVALPESSSSLGWMARLVNGLFKRFDDAMGQIAGNAIHLSRVAPRLAELAQVQEDHARAQRQNAEGIGQASHTLAQTVASIASSAAEASAFSNQVAAAVHSANASDEENRQQIRAIGDSTRALSEQMALLEDSSASIGKVVELIKSIADRTRLLSLNAAIEAARAGEQGRGFAVVADEVRKLADQTTQATQDVEHLLETIQQQVATSSSTMESMNQLVDKGISVSQTAGESIQAASRDITTLIEHVHTIAAASGEQSEKVEAIAAQIGEVVASTQRQLEDAHALAESAGQVRDRSDTLLTAVGIFRFEGHKRVRQMIEEAVRDWKLDHLDADTLDRLLSALGARHPELEMLCITDAHGVQVSSDVAGARVVPEGRGNKWADRRWFQDAVREQQLVVSDLYRSVDTGDYCFTVSTPLFDPAGHLLGVFEADVNFNHIVDG